MVLAYFFMVACMSLHSSCNYTTSFLDSILRASFAISTMTFSKARPGQAGLPSNNPTQSFWHSQPSETLLGHRTTKTLPSEADFVIIGSGISGAFAAHFLQQDARGKDLKVVMLEAREACWGATGRVKSHFPSPMCDL